MMERTRALAMSLDSDDAREALAEIAAAEALLGTFRAVVDHGDDAGAVERWCRSVLDWEKTPPAVRSLVEHATAPLVKALRARATAPDVETEVTRIIDAMLADREAPLANARRVLRPLVTDLACTKAAIRALSEDRYHSPAWTYLREVARAVGLGEEASVGEIVTRVKTLGAERGYIGDHIVRRDRYPVMVPVLPADVDEPAIGE